jgi:hypothetical protein
MPSDSACHRLSSFYEQLMKKIIAPDFAFFLLFSLVFMLFNHDKLQVTKVLDKKNFCVILFENFEQLL